MAAGPMSAAAGIPFIKANACGNDFLRIDGMHAPADLPAFSRRICDRRTGVGADGVEWLFPDAQNQADVRARLFNADGSEAEISGNGTRCVAAHWVAEHGGEQVLVRTGAGIKRCVLNARKGQRFSFETDIGEPQVGEPYLNKMAFVEIKGTTEYIGNPYFVIF